MNALLERKTRYKQGVILVARGYTICFKMTFRCILQETVVQGTVCPYASDLFSATTQSGSMPDRTPSLYAHQSQSESMPTHPMQYAAQTEYERPKHMPLPIIYAKKEKKRKTRRKIDSHREQCRSMIRVRRHEIDTPGSMSVPTRSTPRRERTIHAHAPGIPISAYGSVALPIRIQIFSTPARIPIRHIVSIPVALRRRVRMRPTRVRTPRRRARGRAGRALRTGKGDVVPDSAAGTMDRARAALGRGFRVAAAAGGARPW